MKEYSVRVGSKKRLSMSVSYPNANVIQRLFAGAHKGAFARSN